MRKISTGRTIALEIILYTGRSALNAKIVQGMRFIVMDRLPVALILAGVRLHEVNLEIRIAPRSFVAYISAELLHWHSAGDNLQDKKIHFVLTGTILPRKTQRNVMIKIAASFERAR